MIVLELIFVTLFFTAVQTKSFIKVQNNRFSLDGKDYWYIGTNFWYGANLGSQGPGGNRSRLQRELDHLNRLGIKNLRLQVGSEGPDTEPWRILPSMQSSPGVYNEQILEGLDFVLDEMGKRGMHAIMCLNNFWHWSGGFAQYIAWSNGSQNIPYPYLDGYDRFEEFAAGFYHLPKATALFNDHIRKIISRQNTISRVFYKDDPTIMSWELANEPRRLNASWLNQTACLIKSLDPTHLVTTGVEGNISSTNFSNDHSSPCIDYATFHLWVQNWEIYDPMRPSESLPKAIDFAKKYIDFHVQYTKKPVVLEEFGISRDYNNHSPTASVLFRDEYFEAIFSYARQYQLPLNFWAFGGEGRPRAPFANWTVGDDFIGDPPHEPQGWYSVYNTDLNTLSLIERYTAMISSTSKACISTFLLFFSLIRSFPLLQ